MILSLFLVNPNWNIKKIKKRYSKLLFVKLETFSRHFQVARQKRKLHFFNRTVLTMRLPSWNGVTMNLTHLWDHIFLLRNWEANLYDLKNINFLLLRMSHSLPYVPYTSSISYWVPTSFFLGGGGGGVLIWRGVLIPSFKPKEGRLFQAGHLFKHSQ